MQEILATDDLNAHARNLSVLSVHDLGGIH